MDIKQERITTFINRRPITNHASDISFSFCCVCNGGRLFEPCLGLSSTNDKLNEKLLGSLGYLKHKVKFCCECAKSAQTHLNAKDYLKMNSRYEALILDYDTIDKMAVELNTNVYDVQIPLLRETARTSTIAEEWAAP
ncbi:unnamed protein product [Cylicocyclus nassatus]|uniref:Uncharacterized protein n=1 Tax=Cylicocyclus nassatus TaxID=53992 RepID=A0AA36DQR0_CYLNA|nr:unnamed protein product [Cylicocyclus nassatus]